MTQHEGAQPADADSWYPPSPGPLAVLTPPDAMSDLTRTLRTAAARHGDTAWVHPCPQADRDTVANLGQDILDATGVVGLTRPRAKGERHFLRALTHLRHGPVRHLVIDDAALLEPDVLTELHQVALLAHVQLWLLIDTAERVRGGRDRGRVRGHTVLGWVTDTATTIDPGDALDRWQRRHPTHTCRTPGPAWWTEPLAPDDELPDACPTPAYVDCLLAWVRMSLTAGHLSPERARGRLIEYADHNSTSVEDRWALTAAGRDLYTPALDALGQLHPAAQHATLADVDPTGSQVTVAGTNLPVPTPMRPALARLRSSRHLGGCLPHEPLTGLFDQQPG